MTRYEIKYDKTTERNKIAIITKSVFGCLAVKLPIGLCQIDEKKQIFTLSVIILRVSHCTYMALLT